MQEPLKNQDQTLLVHLEKISFYLLMAAVSTAAFSISLFKISSSALLLVVLLRFFMAKKASLLKNKLIFFSAYFFLLNVFSATQAVYYQDAWRGVSKVLRYLLLSISVMVVVDSRDKFTKVVHCILWTAIFVFVDAMLQKLVGFEINGRQMTPFIGDIKRISGPFKQANDFAAYGAFVFVLFVCSIETFKKAFWTHRILLIAGTGLGAVCLFWSYSRGAWLAMIVAIFLYALLNKKKYILMGLFCLGVWAVFFSPDLVQMRFRTLLESNGTLNERLVLWRESFKMIDKSPFFGLGVNTYTKNAIETLSGVEGLPLNFRIQYLHNGYLQMVVEIGLLGLLSFLALLSYVFVASTQMIRKCSDEPLKSYSVGLVFAIIAFLLHSFVDTNFQSTLLMNWLWLAIGLLWAIQSIIYSDRQKIAR